MTDKGIKAVEIQSPPDRGKLHIIRGNVTPRQVEGYIQKNCEACRGEIIIPKNS